MPFGQVINLSAMAPISSPEYEMVVIEYIHIHELNQTSEGCNGQVTCLRANCPIFNHNIISHKILRCVTGQGQHSTTAHFYIHSKFVQKQLLKLYT